MRLLSLILFFFLFFSRAQVNEKIEKEVTASFKTKKMPLWGLQTSYHPLYTPYMANKQLTATHTHKEHAHTPKKDLDLKTKFYFNCFSTWDRQFSLKKM